MSEKIKNYLGLTVILGMLAATYISISAVNILGSAIPPQATFSVNGQGKVIAIPDIARFSYSVITEGDTNIGKSQDINSKKGNAIIKFLKDNYVLDKDIQTISYNITPRYTSYNCWDWKDTAKPCPPQQISGYTISQTTSVKARDFKKLPDILGGVANLGANNISGLSFEVENPDSLKDQARALAIKQAREKAQAIASSSSFKIGRLIEESEEGEYNPVPYYGGGVMLSAAAPEAKAVSPNVAAGSEEIQVNVTLRYEIK